MDENRFVVDQYLFETEEEYELALNEKKKIHLGKQKTACENKPFCKMIFILSEAYMFSGE